MAVVLMARHTHWNSIVISHRPSPYLTLHHSPPYEHRNDTAPVSSLSEWVPLAWCGECAIVYGPVTNLSLLRIAITNRYYYISSAKDQLTSSDVAIKKILKPFNNPVLSKRTFRELKLLKHLRHDNVCLEGHCVQFIRIQDHQSQRHLHLSLGRHVRPWTLGQGRLILMYSYFVTELLGTDLQRLLGSRRLEKQYIQYFLYQILRGLKYVHSAGVIHRDLKPSNILVNENCELKVGP